MTVPDDRPFCTPCEAALQINAMVRSWGSHRRDMLPSLTRLKCTCGRNIKVNDKALARYYGLDL